MLERIRQLEAASAGLEPSSNQRQEMLEKTAAYAESFLAGLDERKAYVANDGQYKQLLEPFLDTPEEFSRLLDVIRDAVDHEGLNAASGGQMGYIPGGGMFPSALGDFLADISNRYSGVSYASPGAAAMEQKMVRWMTEVVGYPETSGGDLTSGGSIANLTAIITAREIMGIRARDVENSCVYITEGTHHCVDKALRAAGLGECHKRLVPMDKQFRMDADELQRVVEEDISAGLRPWLVTASAGTTDTGAVDPIDKIADIAEQNDMWMHVDAAYGGFFLLCAEGRQVLGGIHRAHSIVLDPHKGLFLPYGSGAVLVRDVTWLARAQAYEADYMQDVKSTHGEYSPSELSLELTRPFRGLRFWLPVKLFGLAPFRAALAEKIWLARYFHKQLEQIPGWEMGPYPQLSVATFRFVPEQGDADVLNESLVEAVLADGKVFISSTRISDKYVLRLAVLHFRTQQKKAAISSIYMHPHIILFSDISNAFDGINGAGIRCSS
jgi:aromatic-L-amino-acid decarboxylase